MRSNSFFCWDSLSWPAAPRKRRRANSASTAKESSAPSKHSKRRTPTRSRSPSARAAGPWMPRKAASNLTVCITGPYRKCAGTGARRMRRRKPKRRTLLGTEHGTNDRNRITPTFAKGKTMANTLPSREAWKTEGLIASAILIIFSLPHALSRPSTRTTFG